MPKAIKDIEGYKFSFFSNEGQEPPHVHVKKGNNSAKFWLLPQVNLAKYYGFKFQEIRKAWILVEKNKNQILYKWYEYFKQHKN